MRRSLLIATLAALASGGVVTTVYSLHGGIETALLLAAVGAAGLAIAHLLAARRTRLLLRRQFVVAVALTVGCVLVATIVGKLGEEEAHAAKVDAARRDLIAAASHDLRTPISALRLIVDAIDDDLVDDSTRRRYQRTMHTHIEALSALIDDLFELSRIEAGEVAWSMRQVSLAGLLDETLQAM